MVRNMMVMMVMMGLTLQRRMIFAPHMGVTLVVTTTMTTPLLVL